MRLQLHKIEYDSEEYQILQTFIFKECRDKNVDVFLCGCGYVAETVTMADTVFLGLRAAK